MEKSVLERYAVDLTAQARAGGLDVVIGREDEIRQVTDILSRRRQNNPLLVGEAGVGKTAVVEGFALAVANREVPRHLEEVDVLALDLGLLQAGATLEGEFEERLAAVLDAVRSAPRRIVLFLDEVHMLIGAGGAAGTGDAANLLKPALARGEVSVIAATTWREYKVHIEPDPALTRRFWTVVVDEPRRDAAIAMLRGVAPTLETHHQVEIRDEAVVEAVDLSTRYVTGRRLPDKAIGLLDTACASVRVAQTGTPAAVERAAREIAWLDREREALMRDLEHRGRTEARATLQRGLLETAANIDAAEARLAQLEAAWQRERGFVRRIRAVREELRKGDRNKSGESEPAPHLQRKLADLEGQLEEIQAVERLVPLDVDRRVVAEVVERWTKIPVARQLTDDAKVLAELEAHLGEHIVGQEPALTKIAQRLRTLRTGLDDGDAGPGSFLLAGPRGVGKTETAHALARVLYGGVENLVVLDMAEFREAHTLSKLRGAPPGYVGHGRGGRLTEAIRRRPYSVVLFDDIDRAHPDVVASLFPIFERGRMEDGEGTMVDFSHALVLMTTSLGERERLDRLGAGLLQRVVTVPYGALNSADLQTLLRRAIDRVAARARRSHDIALEADDAVVERLTERIAASGLAGRGVPRFVADELLPQLASTLLTRAGGEGSQTVRLGVTGDGDLRLA